jgi:hypothetical protein
VLRRPPATATAKPAHNRVGYGIEREILNIAGVVMRFGSSSLPHANQDGPCLWR